MGQDGQLSRIWFVQNQDSRIVYFKHEAQEFIMLKEQFISEMLLLPLPAMEYEISKNLSALFPEKALIEGDGGFFNIEGYARAGLCTIKRQTFSYNQVSTHWKGREPETIRWRGMSFPTPMGYMPGMPISDEEQGSSADAETIDMLRKAWLEVQWQGKTLDVLLLLIEGQGFQKMRHWILAEREEVARGFLAAVCKWQTEIRSEVLVFESGHWHKDEHLFQDIKVSTFDNLILEGTLKQDILDDITQFFAAREIYEEHGIPWKRGILFIGPAGNGKTHAVKALINALEQPCLYVKNFRSPHAQGADEINIRQVFARARLSAPCVLVLEDLDSLVTPQIRSFFLNELDGFAANVGIVTLATTNHPERLDPAIVNRPSRFDRKYHFNLPGKAERQAYITMWNNMLKPALRLSEEGIARITEVTEGFSFAYLKELFLSSRMRWIAKAQQGTMDEVMSGQVQALREQMESTNTQPAPELPEGMPGMPFPGHFGGGVFYRKTF